MSGGWVSSGSRTLERLPPVALKSAKAAELLDVSVKTLHALDIPWRPAGKGTQRPKRLYRYADLVAYMDQDAA